MLELVKLDESHTDFVLDLNNDEVFKKSFPRTSPITKEGHLSFLKKLNTTNDLYYIIKYDNKDIGTVSIYDITETVAEWGRFIIINEYKQLALPVSKMILNIAFNKLNLAMLYCNCLSTNPNVIKFNKLLGFTEENIIKNKYIIDEVNVDMHYLTLYKGKYNGKDRITKNCL